MSAFGWRREKAGSAPAFAQAHAERLLNRPAAVPPMRPRVDIPVRDPCPEESAVQDLLDKGRRMARQDCWEELGLEICNADRARLMTPGLRPVAAILAEGARADAVAAARRAIQRGEPRQAYAAIAALEVNREDAPDCSALAYVIAAAHVDAANAWRGASQARDLAPQRREGFERAMAAATYLCDNFDPFEIDSALWARLRCAVIDGDRAPAQRVCDDYEDLVEIDPGCPDHLRAMGRDLLPSRHGTYEVLDRQARRAAMQLRDVWGMGAYTWIWIGALEMDTAALRRVDVGLFREGLRDIADLHPDQHMINRLAAFTGITVPYVVDAARAGSALSSDFDWIAGERLTELHPIAWALSIAPGQTLSQVSETAGLAEKGRLRALSTLAERFADRLNKGGRLIFTEDGLCTD